jgi:hypothetical protein
VHIFTFDCERIYINLASTAAAAAATTAAASLLLHGACCPQLSPPPFLLLFVDFCLPLPLSLPPPPALFSAPPLPPPFQWSSPQF